MRETIRRQNQRTFFAKFLPVSLLGVMAFSRLLYILFPSGLHGVAGRLYFTSALYRLNLNTYVENTAELN